MMHEPFSRRSFITKTAAITGAVTYGRNMSFLNPQEEKLPREVWIATVSQMGLSADSQEGMVSIICKIIEKAAAYKPDVICLPEVFMTYNVRKRMGLQEAMETSSSLLKHFTQFAKANNCYIICPVYTQEKGKIYNSAVVIDRNGNNIGEYRKVYLPEAEIALGLTPGSLPPPVFKTDFGTIGIQICFDMLWDNGWKSLKQQGAEIVFWPSAYSGGQAVNARAWQNRYIIVTGANKYASKICDVAGNVVAQTGLWDNNFICAPVNMEKAFLSAWPSVARFDEIKAKYGRKIRITNYQDEEWSIIESLSHDVKIKDVLEEFNLKTLDQHIIDSEALQIKARNK